MNAFEDIADASTKYLVFTGEEDSPPFTTTINYIDVDITRDQKQKIFSALKDINHGVVPNFIAQFWAAQKTGEPFVLTTRSQPFGVCGNNKKLVSYLNACKNHNWYAHVETGTAIGLPARVFMSGDHEQTQNVHGYPEDWNPASCENAIFSEKWGSFAVTVGQPDGKRLGVLEIVTDTIKESYEDDIDRLCIALEKAGLQHRFSKLADPKTIGNNQLEVKRMTISRKIAHYNLFAPFFGLPAESVRKRLREVHGYHKGVGETTFKTICRDVVNIPVWPGQRLKRKRKESTTGGRPEKSTRASSASRTPIRQAASETHDLSVQAASETIGNDTSVQESNEMGSPSIQNPLVHDPHMDSQNCFERSDIMVFQNCFGPFDIMDFQCVESPIFPHETRNLCVPDQTSETSDFGISIATGVEGITEWIMSESERPDFMQVFDDMACQRFC